MRSSRSWWCDAVWNAFGELLGPNTRFETSRLSLNAKSRVMSDAKASACRSNISFTCSSHASGTPIGAPGSSRASPLEFCVSTFWMRRSISRTSSR